MYCVFPFDFLNFFYENLYLYFAPYCVKSRFVTFLNLHEQKKKKKLATWKGKKKKKKAVGQQWHGGMWTRKCYRQQFQGGKILPSMALFRSVTGNKNDLWWIHHVWCQQANFLSNSISMKILPRLACWTCTFLQRMLSFDTAWT